VDTNQLVQRTAGLGRTAVQRGARLARWGASFTLGQAQRVAGRSRRPKPGMDDATLKAKVETELFRPADAPKGDVTVGVVDGVVELRGTVKTAKQIRDLERQVREIPEVRGVENLLHQRKTPAPTRKRSATTAREKTARTRRTAARSRTPSAAAPTPTNGDAAATNEPGTDHPRAGDVLGVLARQVETGEHVSEAEIGRELGLDATEVGDILRALSTTNQVTRTSSGKWELTPAGARGVEPRPHPKEPQAG
jgi:hypothetical protein